MITNNQSGTRIDEIESGIYRISTPLPPEAFPGGFSFNQFLVVDDEPLLFHTGPRALFPLVREAIDSVIPARSLKWIGFSHVESDESGALNDFLRIAPESAAVCSQVAAMVSVNDLADRPPRPLADGEALVLGQRTMVWIDAPHVPHNWETGFMLEATTRTLFCGDLFTQGGHQCEPLTGSDILESSEAFRLGGIEGGMPDYFSFAPDTRAVIGRMAETSPRTLACMHGSSWRASNGGSAASMMNELGDRLSAGSRPGLA
jgi:glyoxylase-like metal-dependent hydrolase (beta-lactamase superfamily II)